VEANLLLEAYLKQLHLPGFLRNYRSFAADAARNNEDPVRYLLALAEQEVHQREQNVQRERVRQAHFPVLRELADFDFSAVPSLNKAYVLDLARGDYIARHEPVIFIGNPGLGKTHLALGLARDWSTICSRHKTSTGSVASAQLR
jgi:DNA replication protein DnaC